MKNRHHIWFPRRDYKTDVERKFRNLPCNIVWIDEKIHRLLHQFTEVPKKPSREEMLMYINYHNKGICSCGGGQ